MAYYKDFTNQKSRDEKRKEAEMRGGLQDEGTYRGAGRPPRTGSSFGSQPPRGDGRPPRAGSFGSQPPRGEGRPPRTGSSFGSQPPRGEGRPPRSGSFGSQPPRGEGRPPRSGSFGSQPPRGEGRPPREGGFGNQPPRGEGRPPREGSFGSQPPRGEGRPPRSGSFGNQPPRGEGRPPRSGSFGSQPPLGEGRPPRSGSFGNQPPRGEGRPPRSGDRFGNQPPRGEGRPPREGERFGNPPPRGEGRPPREGERFGNPPPRGEGRPPRSGSRFEGRPMRDGDFRFSAGGQQPYRGRSNDIVPRSYDEQRRGRRDETETKEYQSFRYEAPPRPPRPVYDAPVMEEEEIVPNENLLSGRNPIREALKSGRDIEKLLVARGELSGSAREIIAMAKEQRVPIQEVDRARLDAITPNHQGMLAFASAYQYHTVEDMLALAQERGETPFLVILDGVTDPHNLGAIIRTAECAGAHGVIVQERRAVGLTPAAVKASAGAIEHIMVARVVNLVATLEMLKQRNVWIYAADMQGEAYTDIDFAGGAAIIIGAEGEGVSRLVLEKCDKRVSLPMRGKLDSLNASVAAGILLYAVLRAR